MEPTHRFEGVLGLSLAILIAASLASLFWPWAQASGQLVVTVGVSFAIISLIEIIIDAARSRRMQRSTAYSACFSNSPRIRVRTFGPTTH
jgi:hypothetical protein